MVAFEDCDTFLSVVRASASVAMVTANYYFRINGASQVRIAPVWNRGR